MSNFIGRPPFSNSLWVGIETMQFHIAQTKIFLRTPSFPIQGVPMNNLAPMKNCPGGVQGNLNWMPGYHRVWSLTHRRAITEESKVANRDLVDYQACSLLQYINVIANLFIMGNYFDELRWKIIRANNLLQFIHQVTIEIRFRKSLVQERFKSNLEFRNQIIVSSIKFWKCLAKFMIPIALFKKFLS